MNSCITPLFIILALTAAAPMPVRAAEVKLSLSTVGSRAVRNNPELAAARMRIDEARGMHLQAGRLSNPELGFEYRGSRNPSQRSGEISFDQRFPVTARLRLEKRVAESEVRAAEAEVRDEERKLVAKVEGLAVKLLAAQSQVELRQQQLALAQQLAKFSADRAAKGEISALDASQATVESHQVRVDMGHWQTERTNFTGELKQALGLAPTDTLTLSGELPPPQVKKKGNIEGHPELALAEVRRTQAEADVSLSKAKRWDDVTVGVMAEREKEFDEPVGFENNTFVGFRVSIPLPFWNKNEGEIAAKQAALQRAQMQIRAQRLTLEHEAANARKEMEAHAEFARETHDVLLPLVETQAKKLDQAYQQGQTDLLTVLRVRDQMLKLQTSALDSLRDYHLARVRYEAAVGHGQRSTVNGQK
jgi:cobalt-zinc-cadmium efflux system outer membrane protein